jgi:general secretion pathway protein M
MNPAGKNPAGKNVPENQASFLAPWQAKWKALPAREQQLLLIAGTALALFITWLVAVQPALRTLAAAPAQRAALDLQWQAMQKRAAEAAELRGATPMSPDQSLAALKAATERLGDKAQLSVQGERAVLTLTNVGTAELRDWLSEARSGARARPVEATLSRAAQGYSGTLIVAIGGTL